MYILGNDYSKRLIVVLFVLSGILIAASSTNSSKVDVSLPVGATVIEIEPLEPQGYPHRTMVLWMVNPVEYPDCRQGYYSGATRVSLIDTCDNSIINTIGIKDPDSSDNDDSFELPFSIGKGQYYRLEGDLRENEKAKPHIMFLKDYNGDGTALEFALFDNQSFMNVATSLVGYSAKQDKVIHYPIILASKYLPLESNYWCDSLFLKEPQSPGIWYYQIETSGHGSSWEKYEVKYNREKEIFEGTFDWDHSRDVIMGKCVDLAWLNPLLFLSLIVSFLFAFGTNLLIILFILKNHKAIAIILFFMIFPISMNIFSAVLYFSYNLLVGKAISVGAGPAGFLFSLASPFLGLLLAVYLFEMKRKRNAETRCP